MWVRNGLQIKGQAMTYVQSHFCNSMIDPDIYLLQVWILLPTFKNGTTKIKLDFSCRFVHQD